MSERPSPPLPPVDQEPVTYAPDVRVVPDHKASAIAWLTAVARGEAAFGWCLHTEPEES